MICGTIGSQRSKQRSIFLLEPGLKGMLEWKHCKQYFVVIKPLVEH